MINITVNGQKENVSAECSIAGLLESLSLTGKRVAVERNQEIVPKSRHNTCVLKEGDTVEIVQAIGGG